jgi:lectin, mannose-binding 2
VPNVKLPSVTYLGFSAETGELSDNHDIIKVETKNLYSPSGSTNTGAAGSRDYSRGKGRPAKQSSGGGWFWFFAKFLLFGLAVAGAYVGFTIYRSRQRDRF